MNTKQLFAMALLAGLAIFAMSFFISYGNAVPSKDGESGCDDEGCHDSNEAGQKHIYDDLDVEISNASSGDPDVIRVVLKDRNSGDKITKDRAAEVSQKGNRNPNDPVYQSFDKEDENGSLLDLTDNVTNGDIEHKSDMVIWAGYYDSDSDTYHLGKATWTYYKPNEAPTAVAGLALNDHDAPETYLEAKLGADDKVTIYFNSSGCYDNDGDAIEKYQWDIDGDGIFAEPEDEGDEETCPTLFKRSYDTAGDYYFDFRCVDERGKSSDTLVDIHLKITEPPKRPDLTIDDIAIVNDDSSKSNYEQGDTVLVTLTVKNDGNKKLTESYKINFYYKYKPTAGDDWPDDWELLNDEEDFIVNHDDDDALDDGTTEFPTFEWYTGDAGDGAADVGFYKFKAEVDPPYSGHPRGDVEEFREDDDDGDKPNDLEKGQIELESGGGEDKEPVLSLKDFTAPDRVEVNSLVNVMVTVENTGDGDGYVRVWLLVDGSRETNTRRFTVAAGDSEEVKIEWRAQNEGTFTLKAELDYKNDVVDETGELTLQVTPPNEDTDGDNLPDWWEEFYWGNIIDQNGEGDPDGDGKTNYEEYLAGSNPTTKETGDSDSDGGGSGLPAFMMPVAGAALVVAAVLMRRRD